MAIIQFEAGLAPSSSPAARLFFLSSIGFLSVWKKSQPLGWDFLCICLFLVCFGILRGLLLRLKTLYLRHELGILRL